MEHQMERQMERQMECTGTPGDPTGGVPPDGHDGRMRP